MLRLSSFLRPYRRWVAAVLVLTFVNVMASLYLPNLMSNIVDTGILHGDTAYIIRVGALMLVVTLAGGCANVFAALFASKAMAAFGQGLRLRLFAHVEGFSVGEFDRYGTSSMIVRTTNDVMQVQQLVNMGLRMLVISPLVAIGGVVLAVRMAPGLSLLIVVALPIMGATVYLVMGPGLGLFRAIQAKVDRLNLVLRENLTGVRVVRAFGRTPHEVQRFADANLDVTDTSVKVFQLMATMMPLIMLIMNLTTVAIAWFGGGQINAGRLEVGQLMAFIQYVTQIMFSVMMVSMMMFMIPRGEASAQRILQVLDLQPAIQDPERPVAAPEVRAGGGVEFDHVTFRYPGAQDAALAAVSFRLEPGQWTAVIGGIGSGKSTLVQLVLRLQDCTEGAVRIDGVDARALSQEALRSRIAYVPQRATLFSGSVLENVRYGDMGASEGRVGQALAVAQASDFVAALPGGLDGEIQQGGLNLSGGQRQRLAIARAIVRKAEIYLFDESFSALDYRTDALLRSALRRELSGATVIVVSQRISTVRDADRILVLDDGRLVGDGRHEDLLRTCAVYGEIVASQLQPEEVA